MKRMLGTSLLLLFLGADAATSQPLNYETLASGQNRVTIGMGLDPAVLSALAYTRSVSVGARPAALSIEVALPVARFDGRDYRASVAAHMSIVRFNGLHLAGQARLISRGTRNDIFDAHGVGADLTASEQKTCL